MGMNHGSTQYTNSCTNAVSWEMRSLKEPFQKGLIKHTMIKLYEIISIWCWVFLWNYFEIKKFILSRSWCSVCHSSLWNWRQPRLTGSQVFTLEPDSWPADKWRLFLRSRTFFFQNHMRDKDPFTTLNVRAWVHTSTDSWINLRRLVPRFGLRTPVTERRQTEAQVREEEGKATGNHRLRLEFWITLKKSTFQWKSTDQFWTLNSFISKH